MENKIILNIVFLFLFFDMSIYVLWWVRKIHLNNVQTTATQDKIVFTLVFSIIIKVLCYLGLIVGIKNKYFIALYYIGDFGFLAVSLLIGLIIHQKVKEQIRKMIDAKKENTVTT